MTLDPAQFCRLKIGDHNNLPTDEFLWTIMYPDARHELAVFLFANIDFEDKQAIGIGMRLS